MSTPAFPAFNSTPSPWPTSVFTAHRPFPSYDRTFSPQAYSLFLTSRDRSVRYSFFASQAKPDPFFTPSQPVSPASLLVYIESSTAFLLSTALHPANPRPRLRRKFREQSTFISSTTFILSALRLFRPLPSPTARTDFLRF